MNGYTFSLVSLAGGGGAIVILVYLASIGNVPAMVALAVIVTVLLILLGVGISFAISHMTDMREHKQSMDRLRGRVAAMDEMQDVLNAQNKAVMMTAQKQAMLAARSTTSEPARGDIIDIDATLFSDFDEVAQ
jgi:hypothetical protein